ncbi:MAG: RluA family pseudouridine synthase [Lachnospiraceae bacterium]|nr:RluA family pseudouridine synthase [Lachnospiraceae bacterium]
MRADINIVYEDEDILVCRKPAGLATQSARVAAPDLVSELKNYLAQKNESYLAVIHRLDQPVEGLLVFAKNKTAAEKLNEQLRKNEFNKVYYAVAFNQPPVQEGMLEDYMIKDGSRAKIVTADTPGAKKAALHYKLIAIEKGRSLYEVRLETGRFHQIRAQMAHAGMPLLGDKKYADAAIQIYSEMHGIKNVALCAYKLKLIHPRSGEEMLFVSKPAGDVFQDFQKRKINNENRQSKKEDDK